MTLTAPLKTLVRDPRQYTRHVHGLAGAFNVSLLELDVPPEMAGAKVAERQVLCRPVVDETSYAVAMHELGHILAPSGALRVATGDADNWELKMAEEEAAWEWAEHYVLDWTPAMEQVKALSLGSYRTHYEQHRRVQSQRARQVVAPVSAFVKQIAWHS
jgi:hypothetical protein